MSNSDTVDAHEKVEASQHLPCLTPDIITHILSFLTPEDPLSVPSLIACQLVSGTFSYCSKAEHIWLPFIHGGLWHCGWPTQRVDLPKKYCTVEDQEALDAIYADAERTRTPSQPFSAFGFFVLRCRLDRFALDQLDTLVNCSTGHVRPYTILCTLNHHVLDAVFAAACNPDLSQTDWKTGEYWATEVMLGMQRWSMTKGLRNLDRQGAPLSQTATTIVEVALAGLSAFAGASPSEMEELTHYSDLLARDATAMLSDLDLTSLSMQAESTKIPLVPYQVLKSLQATLALYGLIPPSSDAEAGPLDGNFLNLVRKHAATRGEEVDFTLAMRATTLGRPGGSFRTTDILGPALLGKEATVSWTIFSVLFCEVAAKLGPGLGVELWPTVDPRLVKIGRWEGKKPTSREEVWYFHLGKQQLVSEEKKGEGEGKVASAFDLLHLISTDIASSLASTSLPTDATAPTIPLASALYVQYLLPSVLSRPYTGPEAVIRLSSSAVKLAQHVARYWPLDLGLLGEVVLPLVEGGKELVQGLIERGGEGVVERRRREGEGSPKFGVGKVVRSKEGWCGVVAGWDVTFDQEVCDSIEPVTPKLADLPRRKQQPFYWILSPDLPTHHWSFTHYTAEDALTPLPRATVEEFDAILQVPGLGRWFGLLLEEGGGRRLVPSVELMTRFPDDVYEGDEEEKEDGDQREREGLEEVV